MPLRPNIRPYEDGDLGRVVRLIERKDLVDGETTARLTLDDVASLVESDLSETLLAEMDGELVGFATGVTVGSVATIHRIVGDRQVLDPLLDTFERQLANSGASTFIAALRGDSESRAVLTERGYEASDDLAVMARQVERKSNQLAELGGRHVDPDLWDQLQGMERFKDIIERRIILPLAQPDLAERHGVRSPQSVILFGPPGTGKTTFAKGVAARVGWPFVPIQVAELAGEAANDPTLLTHTFERILSAPAAVAFVDEVEDLAADRQSHRQVSPHVTNEFLKQLPRVRDSDDHLLICATNDIGALDPAFLRPGRFDHIIPVGPPDAEARAAIWRGYIDEITDEDVDVDALVDASRHFTPADIDYAAGKAAQLAFEAEYDGVSDRRADTDTFLSAIAETPASLTDETISAFEEDVETYARY